MTRLIFRHTILALMIVLSCTTAFAVDTILQQAAERCAKFETDVKDMRLVQEMRTVTSTGDLTFEQTVYIKGKKSRVEMSMPLAAVQGGEGAGTLMTVVVNDGVNAWIFSPLGEKKPLSEEEARSNQPASNCWGYFPDNARVSGSDTVQGRDCYIVELEEDGIQTRLWLDKSNFVPVQGETHDSTDTEHYRWTHSDFHTIRGDWEYPYITEMYEGTDLAATMSVSSLDVNQGLSDDLFNPDSVHVKPLDLENLLKMLAPPEDSLR